MNPGCPRETAGVSRGDMESLHLDELAVDARPPMHPSATWNTTHWDEMPRLVVRYYNANGRYAVLMHGIPVSLLGIVTRSPLSCTHDVHIRNWCIGSASSFGIIKNNTNTPSNSKICDAIFNGDISDTDSVYINGEIIVNNTKTINCQSGIADSCLPREKLTCTKSSVVYRCKKCRFVLASDHNVLSHQNADKSNIQAGNYNLMSIF